MNHIIKSLRGMSDMFGTIVHQWSYIENIIKKVLITYGYNEIRFPIIENTKLFEEVIGYNSEIVNKEMYTFLDKKQKSITLRPEGTSSCARAIIEHNLWQHNNQLKLWYYGPMFRYERPQTGRCRQFNQFGAEVFGIYTPEIEVEIIVMLNSLWKKLGIFNFLKLEINNIGTLNTRLKYNQIIKNYLKDQLSLINNKAYESNILTELLQNPIKLFDKHLLPNNLKLLLKTAPKLSDYLDPYERNHFSKLCFLLKSLGIKFNINTKLVRGLNYYTGTVFEWKTKYLGSQNTICGGGRYNSLIEQMSNKIKPIVLPGIGFSLGMERLMLLLNKVNPNFIYNRNPINIIFITDNDSLTIIKVFELFQLIQLNLPTLKIIICYQKSKIKKKLAYANKIDAMIVLILTKIELQQQIIIIKDLEQNKTYSIDISKLIETLINIFNHKKYI